MCAESFERRTPRFRPPTHSRSLRVFAHEYTAHLPSPLFLRDAPLESENAKSVHKVTRFVLLDPCSYVDEELCFGIPFAC